MNIIFNPLDNKALTEDQLKGNDDIIFDLRGHNIFAKGVKFYGTDTHDWGNIINAPDKLPNPESLTIFDVSYDGSKPVTITPNNYIYKVAKANITTNPITDKMAFIGTYYEPSTYVESVNNTPLRYSISDIWDSWLKPKIDNWYETQGSKVDATLWGNKFTGTENISNSIYLSAGSQIFVKNTEILDYSNGSLYVGYGTRLKNSTTYIYGGNSITLLTKGTSDISKSFKMTLANINTDLPIYANDTMNITNGLYLSSHIIGKLSNTTQSYTDPWQDSKADFRFGGSLAATKIYASQGFYHSNYDSTTGDTYLLTANGGTTTVKDIRSAIQVKQDNNHSDSYPLIWTNEANADSKNDSNLYKSYDKLTFNPSAISLTIGSSNNPINHSWIEGMTRAAINTYSNGYRAWMSGSTSSGRLSIGSFGDNTSGTDGNIYFSYATKDNISNGTNNVTSNIWINPKTNIINSTHYSGYSYTATGGYHLQKNGSDVVAGLIATDGDYYQTTNTTYYGNHPWGCIPVITKGAGVMEIGKYIDFHNDNNGYDYSTRLNTDGHYGNNVLMPKKSGRLLVESDLDNIKPMYEVVVNLHPSNYVLNSNNEYVPGFSYSENTWYPVEIQLFTVGKYGYPVIRGEILQYLDCGYTNSQGTRVSTGSGNCSWMTHQHGFSTRIVFESQASGWGTTPNNILRVMDANQAWCVVNPVRNMVQDYKSDSIVVWCRGYGEYRFRFDYPHVGVIVHNSSFSLGSTDNTYTPYTFSSAINNTADPSWNEVWNDLNGKLPEIKPTLGYWANIAVSNTSNENTAPTFYTVWAQNMFRSRGDSGWYNETYEDGIVMKQSNWIETWAGANIYTSGAMSAGKLLVGFNKKTDTNYDLYILNTNGSKFNGTINTACGAILATKPSIDFRGGTGIGTWTSWCHHENSGNEALLFATENIDTTIMFANNIKQSTITNSLFQSITAPLRIQQNKVWMGYGYKSNPSSDYILNVNGDTEINGNLYTKNINYCDKSSGYLIIGDKTQEVGIRSSSNPTINALYLKNRLSSNVVFSANQGFCITPYYLSDNPYTDNTIIISGDKYKATTIGNGTRTISCIIASKCFIPPSFGTIKGYLIRFLPGNDGQIVILKNLYTKGNGSELPLYVRPEGCDIIAVDRSSIYIKNGTLSTSFNDDDSRIFIYVAKYFVWVEFYCG